MASSNELYEEDSFINLPGSESEEEEDAPHEVDEDHEDNGVFHFDASRFYSSSSKVSPSASTSSRNPFPASKRCKKSKPVVSDVTMSVNIIVDDLEILPADEEDFYDPDDPPSRPSTSHDMSHDIPSENLTSAELRSRKRRRGQLHGAVGTAFKKLKEECVKARDGPVWHRDPNLDLPRYDTHYIPRGSSSTIVQGITRPCDFFALLFDDTMMATICVETNRKIETLRSQFKKADSYTFGEVSLMELKAFLGLLILSGIRKDNHVATSDMWSLLDGSHVYRAVMTERRFAFLLRVIRFDDSATRQERRMTDKMDPIRKIWNMLIQHCKENYKPGPHTTVDEQLIPFRGRCPFKMYIPNKPAKYGLKVVMACDADTHYMINAIPYMGKGSVELPKGMTLGEIFTMELVQPYHRRGRTVTTDSWFTSLPLALSLKDVGMNLVGTIRQKPYIPQCVINKTMEVGSSVAAFSYAHNVTLQCQRVNSTKWVLLLSTFHHQPSVIENYKSDIQMFYNATKGGVDCFDQLCSISSCARKTRRWPLAYFFGMLNMVMVNSYILYTDNTSLPKRSRRQFYKELMEGLCYEWVNRRYRLFTFLSRDLKHIMRITFNHPEIPQEAASSRLETRTRCFMCPSNTHKKSRISCVHCHKPVCASHQVICCANCKNV
ncbi:piggyBac transposable element-derived protein 4-like [Palaemon carinicauda]|uniref:piggyBac transposable element-derived protein 4-like n=1 Tax=Palaemon carinicauda TaxID=392227 RepID=UPI0035B5BC64